VVQSVHGHRRIERTLAKWKQAHIRLDEQPMAADPIAGFPKRAPRNVHADAVFEAR
jgi:hypothetical protein